MKITIIALALSLASTAAFARPGHTRPPRPPSGGSGEPISAASAQTSIIQTVAYVIADTLVLSSDESSNASSRNQKMEALQLQSDIMDYAQTGMISLNLADKINMVNAINTDLSVEESIDALILASEIVLK